MYMILFELSVDVILYKLYTGKW